jgi:hypothetical protein
MQLRRFLRDLNANRPTQSTANLSVGVCVCVCVLTDTTTDIVTDICNGERKSMQ